MRARGHVNIRATHRTTLEITTEENLTPRGDCIIGVKANKAARDLRPEAKEYLRSGQRVLLALVLPGQGLYDTFYARGHPDLTFTDRTSIVVRKSSYIDGRTIAVNSQKAAYEIDRRIIEEIKNPDAVLLLYILPGEASQSEVLEAIREDLDVDSEQ
nr:DUF371 domain-containing protein [Thermofilum pendens]